MGVNEPAALGQLEIGMLDPTAAHAVRTVVDLVNTVYAVAEAGMWSAGTARTTAREVTDLAAAGRVFVARRAGRIVGCIKVTRLDEHTAEFGMLAADPAARGSGIGGALVGHAESHCADTGVGVMQLEVLRPSGAEHESKVFLAGWYPRLGYTETRVDPIESAHPDLAPLLAVPAEVVTYRKPLGPSAAWY